MSWVERPWGGSTSLRPLGCGTPGACDLASLGLHLLTSEMETGGVSVHGGRRGVLGAWPPISAASHSESPAHSPPPQSGLLSSGPFAHACSGNPRNHPVRPHLPGLPSSDGDIGSDRARCLPEGPAEGCTSQWACPDSAGPERQGQPTGSLRSGGLPEGVDLGATWKMARG